MAVGDAYIAVSNAYVFPGFLTPVLIELFFPKPPTTFLTCFCRGERRKYTGKKVRLNRGSNSQPPGHESDIVWERVNYSTYFLPLVTKCTKNTAIYNQTHLTHYQTKKKFRLVQIETNCRQHFKVHL